MALVTVAELKHALRLATEPDVEDARIAIDWAEGYLSGELGCRFGLGSVSETFRVSVGAAFQPLPVPLLDVTAVSVDGAALVEVTQWERTRTGVVCPDGFGQDVTTGATVCDLTVSYQAGYAAIPGELRSWGAHLAGLAYTRGPMPGAKSVSVDGVSESFDPALGLDPVILRSLRNRYGRGGAGIRSVRVR